MLPRKEDPRIVLAEIMMGNKTPIEDQEKRGQALLEKSNVLPKEIIGNGRDVFEKMGIAFGEDADDIFVYCTLPDGWKKVPTDHSMWSNLIDDKGRKRASIFYKAAFYDRSAHMHASRRYNYSPYHRTDADGIMDEHGQYLSTIITDCDEPIKLIGTTRADYSKNDRDKRDKLSKKAHEWLDKNYPDWEDVSAYWD